MIIGITGSFGSGKTTVSLLFKKYGYKIINADKLYSKIYKSKSLKNKLKKEFGTFNRNEIKKIVFNDFNKLKKLNKITHPLIISNIKKIIDNKKVSLKNKKINKKTLKKLLIKKNKIIIDAPLLLETNTNKLVDKIIVIKCDKRTQINRILKKKKYSRKEIDQIIKSQMPLKKKIKYADFIVDNSKSIENLRKQIKNIIENLFM